MTVVKTIQEVRDIVAAWRKEGLSVGLVPTMGYLHEGHKSLVCKSAEQNDRTVVSVFVNPIQFGPTEDLERYPRDLEHDKKVVEEAGGDLIFNPEPSEMYPQHFTSFIDTTETTELLCGAVRPVHHSKAQTPYSARRRKHGKQSVDDLQIVSVIKYTRRVEECNYRTDRHY